MAARTGKAASRAEPRFSRLTSEERRAELVAAGLACMARGGIQEFTIDKICVQAGISRGLITHHFGSINGLLAAVYAAVYRASAPDMAGLAGPEERLIGLIDSFFAPKSFNREMLNIWIALWGQISNNAELGAEHQRQYGDYLKEVTQVLTDLAHVRGRMLPPVALAKGLICLVDGLGLQHCLDPKVMPVAEARAICLAYLEPHLGKLG